MITISQEAKDYIIKAVKAKGGIGMSVQAIKGGCSGMQFKFSIVQKSDNFNSEANSSLAEPFHDNNNVIHDNNNVNIATHLNPEIINSPTETSSSHNNSITSSSPEIINSPTEASSSRNSSTTFSSPEAINSPTANPSNTKDLYSNFKATHLNNDINNSTTLNQSNESKSTFNSNMPKGNQILNSLVLTTSSQSIIIASPDQSITITKNFSSTSNNEEINTPLVKYCDEKNNISFGQNQGIEKANSDDFFKKSDEKTAKNEQKMNKNEQKTAKNEQKMSKNEQKIDENTTFYIENSALMFVIGSTLNYVKTGTGGRLIFENSNIKSKCGCGKSFK